MQNLKLYLQQFFGGMDPKGRRLAAVSESHAVHEAGYDVCYSRYSVVYRDLHGELSLGAEFDDDGVLVVHSGDCRDRETVERIGIALKFLGVKYDLQ